MIKKEGGTMDRDTIFLYVIAVIASCFGLINCIQFFLKGNKTAQTVGTIISFKTINPENSKFRNSKWVTVSYKWKNVSVPKLHTSTNGVTDWNNHYRAL